MVKIGMLLHPERGVDAVFEEARQADQQGYRLDLAGRPHHGPRLHGPGWSRWTP